MPDYADVYITVLGGVEAIKNFRNNILDGKFNLNQHYPIPKSQKNNWYDWRNQNWGTKWDVDTENAPPTITLDEAKKIEINFQVPWCGPREWAQNVTFYYKKYLKRNLRIDMEWSTFEQGGKFIVTNGKILEDRFWDEGFSSDDDDMEDLAV